MKTGLESIYRIKEESLPTTLAGRIASISNLIEVKWTLLPWYKKLFIRKSSWRDNQIKAWLSK